MGEWSGPAGIKRFESDVFGDDKVDIVLILEGINDICHPVMMGKPEELPATEELIDGLQTCAAIARRRGAAVIACTLPPFGGYEHWSPELEQIRSGYNDWIRNNAVFDDVLDFAAVLADEADPLKMPNAWHVGDGLHPNPEAGKVIAESQAFTVLRRFL
jgi:lysophospholipase L1-like esterase